MNNSLSMTTKRRKQANHWRPIWKLRKNETGELQFIPIKDKKFSENSSGTIYATVTSSVMKSADKARALSTAIFKAGGSVSVVSVRLVSVATDEDKVEDIGDVFDSFGCQWDFERDV